MTTIAVAEYVRQYTPQPIREKFDSPTPAGLAKAIETRVRREPNFGVELLDCLRAKGAQPTYVRGVLQGLGGAVADGKNIEWPLLLRLLPWVAEQDSDKAAGDLSTYDYADPTWIWAQREALKLLSLAAASDDPALAEDDELWHALNSALSSNATWAEPLETVGTMNAALIAALNTLAGDAAKAFVDAALWNYRLFKKSEGGVPFRVEHFRAGVTAILTQPGTAADAARVRLGQFLPQMILLDREWMLSQSAKMFAPGFVPPLTNPVWGGYITSQRVFDSIFKDLHSWYRAAAQALPTLDDAALLGEAADATWSTTRHLVLHALIAVLRGVAELNDELVTLAFSRSPVADRSHAYWEVFSGWNRDSDSIPREAVERLLRFWTWRLEELSRRSAGERRAESGALGWLFLTKAVPADQVPALIAKTAEFAEGSFTMEHSMWERLLEVAAIDIETTIEVADKIIRAELLGEYPHFNIADVGPVLVAAASSGNRTAAQRGRDLVNLLGDRGFTEFGTLL
jgi:hypothetical protein